MDDDALAREVRAGLERRAAQAQVDHAVVDRAGQAARRRRTSRWVVLGAAASVAVAVAVTGLVVGGEAGDVPVVVDPTVAPSDPAVEVQRLRTESWGDVQIEVPADWGYGAAPMGRAGGDTVTCYPGASLDATGTPVTAEEERTLPYVGRPVASTDVCVPYPDNRPDAPATDYAWLGAAVAPGVVELANGLVQETIVVGGTTVTVASDDPALRRLILGSASEGERCMAELERSGPIGHDPATDPATDPEAAPVTLRVCAYRLDTDRPSSAWELTYAADLGPGPLADYSAAVAAGERPIDQCPGIDYQLTHAVVLELLDAEGAVLRQDAVNPFASCAGVAVGAERVWELETTRLTAAMTRPWVVGGVGAVVYGDPGFGFLGAHG